MDKRASLCPYRPFKVFRSHMLCLKWGFESDLAEWMIIGQAGKTAWMRMILCKHDTSIWHGNDAIGNDRTLQIQSERDCRDWLVPLARPDSVSLSLRFTTEIHYYHGASDTNEVLALAAYLLKPQYFIISHLRFVSVSGSRSGEEKRGVSFTFCYHARGWILKTAKCINK